VTVQSDGMHNLYLLELTPEKDFSFSKIDITVREYPIIQEIDSFMQNKDFSNIKITFVLISRLCLSKPKNLFKLIYDVTDKLKKPTPFIYIGLDSLFQKHYNHELDFVFNYTHAINFLDSSIWHNYVNYLCEDFQQKLATILKKLKENEKLYELNICKEDFELSVRKFQNSYLESFGDHSKHVSPFIFHSETKMQEKTRIILENKTEIIKLSWRCLLIDDFANVELSGLDGSGLTKNKIITDIIESENIQIISVSNPKSSVKFQKRNIIWKALKKLSQETYDVILLDYLLGENKKKKGTREYSHELLNLLDKILAKENGYNLDDYSELAFYMQTKTIDKSDNEKKLIKLLIEGINRNKGPLGKFWIFNISSFQTAFLDRLREQALGHNSEHWYLSRGGDPVNTPELFKYTFFSFLSLQLSHVIFTKDELIKFIIQNKIFKKNNKDELDLRVWAKGAYGSFMYRFGKREIISKDFENQSAFAGSVIKYLNNQIELEERTYYDQLRQLLFQLAYGTGYNIRQTIELFYLVKQELQNTELKDTFFEIGKYLEKILNNY